MAEGKHLGATRTETLRRDYVPAADYSPEFHRLEIGLLWPRVWQPACRLEEISGVGDYVNYEIGEESILIVRNTAEAVKAFYNVCPHRGRRLRDDERGNLSAIFCGYHAWTFDLDGRPITIPAREDWQGCPAISDDDLSLTRVKAEIWGGWVWINMDPESEPLLDFLQYIPDWLGAFEWENCRIRWYKTLIFPINWKVALEAFVEGYHSIGTHPQLMRFGDMHLPGFPEDLEGEGRRHGSHLGFQHYEYGPDKQYPTPRDWLIGQLREVHETLHGIVHEDGARAIERLRGEASDTLTLAEVAEKYTEFLKQEMAKSGVAYPSGLTGEHMLSTEWHIFPNTSILPSPEGAFWYRSRPNGDDPNSTIFDVISLGRFAAGTEPKWTREVFADPAEFKGQNPILEQDFSNMLAVHKGMRSRGFKGARPNPVQESNVYNLHRVLHGFMFGGSY
jgi:phenylpropionate dioxygenase-like ring-hydroxylating dioxygenase large terminal subunit